MHSLPVQTAAKKRLKDTKISTRVLRNVLCQDPVKVVNAIVDAATDKYPPMWYFPGNAAGVMR